MDREEVEARNAIEARIAEAKRRKAEYFADLKRDIPEIGRTLEQYISELDINALMRNMNEVWGYLGERSDTGIVMGDDFLNPKVTTDHIWRDNSLTHAFQRTFHVPATPERTWTVTEAGPGNGNLEQSSGSRQVTHTRSAEPARDFTLDFTSHFDVEMVFQRSDQRGKGHFFVRSQDHYPNPFEPSPKFSEWIVPASLPDIKMKLHDYGFKVAKERKKLGLLPQDIMRKINSASPNQAAWGMLKGIS